MDKKTYVAVTTMVFLIVALLHLARLFAGWDAVIGGWEVPLWVSWLALLVSGFLAWSGFKLATRG
jgi:hypothetical protein